MTEGKEQQHDYHVVPTSNAPLQNGEHHGESNNNDHDADEKTSSKCLSRSGVNIKAFTVSMSFILMTNVAHSVYASGMLTSIEKRFNFGGSQLGLIMAFYDMGQIPASFIIPHIAHNRHRPRIIAIGTIITAIASFTCALPHFILGSGVESLGEINPLTNKTRPIRSEMQVCGMYGSNHSSPLDMCGTDDEKSRQSNMIAYVILALSFIVKGIGSVPNFTLGVPYIDDHVKGASLPIYYGVLFSALGVGVSAGYLTSGAVNKIYVDLSTPDFTPRDPQWISAWWLGFVIISAVLLIAGCTMLLFPESRNLSQQNTHTRDKEEEIKTKQKIQDAEAGIGSKIKDYLTSVRRLMTNVCFVVLIVSAIFEGYLRDGLFKFMAKYMEAEYHTSASAASFAKVFVGPALILGVLVGSYFTSKVSKTTEQKARLLILVGVITTGITVVMMCFGCGASNIAGRHTSEGFDLKLPCNSNCSCDESSFTPVCGADGITYFSPCHAGCTHTNYNQLQLDSSYITNQTHSNSSYSTIKSYGTNQPQQGSIYNYTNCACSGSALPGKCPRNCNLFIAYNVMNYIGALVAVVAGPAGAVILLRIVEAKDRSRALGFKSAIMNLLGDFPRPPIIGAAIDSTCLVWQKKCGVRGHCWLYDIVRFRFTIHGLGIGARVIATACIIIVWYRIRRYGLANEDEEDKKHRLKKEGVVEGETEGLALTDQSHTKLDSRDRVV